MRPSFVMFMMAAALAFTPVPLHAEASSRVESEAQSMGLSVPEFREYCKKELETKFSKSQQAAVVMKAYLSSILGALSGPEFDAVKAANAKMVQVSRTYLEKLLLREYLAFGLDLDQARKGVEIHLADPRIRKRELDVLNEVVGHALSDSEYRTLTSNKDLELIHQTGLEARTYYHQTLWPEYQLYRNKVEEFVASSVWKNQVAIFASEGMELDWLDHPVVEKQGGLHLHLTLRPLGRDFQSIVEVALIDPDHIAIEDDLFRIWAERDLSFGCQDAIQDPNARVRRKT